ncbi:adenosylcobinamide kinase [Bacillus sp. UMB0899]|nr:adenosylcobinamide kinase [Bacillus sp. UMB0899]
MIAFVSGGVRSGKSQFAEKTAKMLAKERKGNLYYLATARKSDEEMVERIRMHQKDRGKTWNTVEEPYDIEKVLKILEQHDVILLDCLTIWLSNVMFDLDYRITKLEESVIRWITLASKKQFSLVIVSNEVNEGNPFSDEFVLTYIYSIQKLHQLIVKEADVAVVVQAGIPTYWKGGGE